MKKCGAFTVFLGLGMLACGGYLAWKSFTHSRTDAQTLDAQINQCVASYPGVCSRTCRTEISQMGFNWGSFVLPEKTCKPKPSECCCRISQAGIQEVTQCQDKRSCPGINVAGIQSTGCLPQNKLPLINGNRSNVCGVNTEFFCTAQTRLAEYVPILSDWAKYVGYTWILSSFSVIVAGGVKMLDSENSESCVQIMTGCAICMNVLAFYVCAFYESFLYKIRGDIKPLCMDDVWSTATEGCNPTCRTAVTRLMDDAVCQELKIINSLHVLVQVYFAFVFLGMVFLFGICCRCCEKKKTTTKYYQFQNVAQQGAPHAPSAAYGQPYPLVLSNAYVPPVYEENK
jgi:hypothetical protein